jgi:uncharacterized Zn finger protein
MGQMEGKMNPPAEFEFTVGEKYENEKGPFKVMSIEKDEMLIRWANGEEAQTSIEFQGRIQARRSWEKSRQKAAAPAKPAPRKAKSPKSSKPAPPAE